MGDQPRYSLAPFFTALATIAALMLGVWGLAQCTRPAHAHDDAQWIADAGLRGPDGVWCCGPGDCFVVPAERVRIKRDGYHVTIPMPLGQPSVTEIIPHGEVQPSPDGKTWRCQRPDGSRRCFFSNPGGV